MTELDSLIIELDRENNRLIREANKAFAHVRRLLKAAFYAKVFQGEVMLVRVVNVPAPDNARFATSKTICTFRTVAGHEVVWFATGNAPSLDQSPRYVIKGRVKKHDSFRGVDQTVLQRVSFKRVEENG